MRTVQSNNEQWCLPLRHEGLAASFIAGCAWKEAGKSIHNQRLQASLILHKTLLILHEKLAAG